MFVEQTPADSSYFFAFLHSHGYQTSCKSCSEGAWRLISSWTGPVRRKAWGSVRPPGWRSSVCPCRCQRRWMNTKRRRLHAQSRPYDEAAVTPYTRPAQVQARPWRSKPGSAPVGVGQWKRVPCAGGELCCCAWVKGHLTFTCASDPNGKHVYGPNFSS